MEQGNPYRHYVEGKPYRHYVEGKPSFAGRPAKRKDKKQVAKDGAKRGSVEASVALLVSQLLLTTGASPELLNLVTADNVGLIAAALILLTRISEAVVADGNETEEDV